MRCSVCAPLCPMPLAALALLVGLSSPTFAQDPPGGSLPPRDIVIGKTWQMPSKVFDQPIRLDVALPEDYERHRDPYPVLFAFQSDFAAVSGMVGNLARASVVPPMIVVGVGLEPAWFSLQRGEGEAASGRADDVLRAIREDLIPFVEARFRTRPYRIFLGHSSSALFLLYATFAAPDQIQTALAAGPMFADVDPARVSAILEEALAARPARRQHLFYTQGDQPELGRGLAAFGALLNTRKPAGLTWEFDPEPDANHGSLHVETLYDGLRTLYAPWATLPEEVAVRGGAAIRAYQNELSQRFGYDIGLARLADYRVRVRWTEAKNHDALVALARFQSEERPKDYFAEYALALAFEAAGRWKEAVASWESCIARAKANESADRLASILPRLEARLAAARKKLAGGPSS